VLPRPRGAGDIGWVRQCTWGSSASLLGFRSAAASRRSKRQINKHVKPRSNASNEPGQLRQKVPKLVVVCRIGEVDIQFGVPRKSSRLYVLVLCVASQMQARIAYATVHQWIGFCISKVNVHFSKLTRDSKLKPRFSLFDGYTSAINWECGGQMAATKVSLDLPSIEPLDLKNPLPIRMTSMVSSVARSA
jgi:hypothetical protein